MSKWGLSEVTSFLGSKADPETHLPNAKVYSLNMEVQGWLSVETD